MRAHLMTSSRQCMVISFSLFIMLPFGAALPYGEAAYGMGGYAAISPPDSVSRSGGGGGGGYVSPSKEKVVVDDSQEKDVAKPAISESPKAVNAHASTTTDETLVRDVEERIAELKGEGFSINQLKMYTRDVRNALAAKDQERAAQLAREVSLTQGDAREARSIVAGMDAMMNPKKGKETGFLTGNVVSPLTGDAILPNARELVLTNTLLRRARVAIEGGDFATGLVLAKQAQASYVIEQQARGGLSGFLQDYGLLMIIGICCFALIAFTVRVSTAKRDDASAAVPLTGWAADTGDAVRKDALSTAWTEYDGK